MKEGLSIQDDIRYAVRNLARSPHVFLGSVIALALGIGATTATLSIVDAIFFRPLPGISRSSELVALYTDNRKTPAVD